MIYLDNAATSLPKPPSVLLALEEALHQELGNPGRSGHHASRAADLVVRRCRSAIAGLLNARDGHRIIFTLNGTDSLNLAIKGILRKGDHAIMGVFEHNSVRRPLVGLLGRDNVTTIDANPAGQYRPEDALAAIRPTTRLVVLTHASNVTGVIQPIAAIGELCRKRAILFLVDAAQTAGAIPIDVQAMNIDLLAAPAHKALLGPPGVGVLYVGPRAEVAPWREGGTGQASADERQPLELPTRLEAGTANVLGLTGLLAGVDGIIEEGLDRIAAKEAALRRQLVDSLRGIPGIELLSTEAAPEHAPVVSFTSAWASPEEVATILDERYSIAVRAGLHCAPDAHRWLGTFPVGTVRVSPGFFTEPRDIGALRQALLEMSQSFASE